jgi:branched-chain amino acid transport system permease protein
VRVLRYWAVESAVGGALLAGLVALVAVWGWQSPSEKDKVTHFFINVVFVVALQLFSGNSGILSFGQMAFIGIGAYTASVLTLDPVLKPTVLAHLPHAIMTSHVSFALAVLAAAAVAGVVALVTAFPLVRLDGASAVIAILSLLLIADVAFSAGLGIAPQGSGEIYGLPEETTMLRALYVAVGAVIVARLFKDSKTGVLLQASREDPFAAASNGVPVRTYRARAWILNGIVSGAGGAVFAWFLGTISATDFFLAPTFALIVMFVVGGTGTVSGAVVGAALVTVVQEGVRQYEGRSLDLRVLEIHRLTGLAQIVLVVMILAVLFVRREGIVARRELDESLRRLLARAS